jgi:hypothetical protein
MDGMPLGLAPGVADVIDSVTDKAARALFRMILQQHQERSAIDLARHTEVVALLSSVSSGLIQTKDDIADIKRRIDGPPPHPVAYWEGLDRRSDFPSEIHARTASNSSVSTPRSGSSGSKRSSSSNSSNGPLQCPFCSKRHDSERVHVQHMNRILDQ